MQLNIITPEKKIFSGTITSLTVPGAAGSFQVLGGHAPIISLLNKGKVVYLHGDTKSELFIEKGLLTVKADEITLLIEDKDG